MCMSVLPTHVSVCTCVVHMNSSIIFHKCVFDNVIQAFSYLLMFSNCTNVLFMLYVMYTAYIYKYTSVSTYL